MSAPDELPDIAALIDRVRDERTRVPESERLLVAIVGAPASGKSVLAGRLRQALADDAALVPMDGFHLDDALLEPAGLRAVKGAPETFDVRGLDALLMRLAPRDTRVYVPVFDRDRELSRAAAAVVPPGCGIVVVEGNYLLLDRPRWRELNARFGLTVMLETPEEELEARLLQRWRGHGIEESEVRRRIYENDLPNGRTVRDESLAADVMIRSANVPEEPADPPPGSHS